MGGVFICDYAYGDRLLNTNSITLTFWNQPHAGEPKMPFFPINRYAGLSLTTFSGRKLWLQSQKIWHLTDFGVGHTFSPVCDKYQKNGYCSQKDWSGTLFYWVCFTHIKWCWTYLSLSITLSFSYYTILQASNYCVTGYKK